MLIRRVVSHPLQEMTPFFANRFRVRYARSRAIIPSSTPPRRRQLATQQAGLVTPPLSLLPLTRHLVMSLLNHIMFPHWQSRSHPLLPQRRPEPFLPFHPFLAPIQHKKSLSTPTHRWSTICLALPLALAMCRCPTRKQRLRRHNPHTTQASRIHQPQI